MGWERKRSANFHFFSVEKTIGFLSSREDILRVVAFNGVLIYFGSYLSYLFSRLLNISGFLLYWPNTPFCSHCPYSHCIVIYDVFLTQPAYITYRVEENYNIADLKGSLINIFAIYILFLVFTASLCVRSSDVIVVVGIIFISILICYFGQDWWYFPQICHCIYWLFSNYWSTDYCVNTCHYL
jgi:hypothetical protein